jgi:phage terminase small subunit
MSTLSSLEKEEVKEEVVKGDRRVAEEMILEVILEEGVLLEGVAEAEKERVVKRASPVLPLLATKDPKVLQRSISYVAMSKRVKDAQTARSVRILTKRRTSTTMVNHIVVMPPRRSMAGLTRVMKVTGQFQIGSCVRIPSVSPT